MTPVLLFTFSFKPVSFWLLSLKMYKSKVSYFIWLQRKITFMKQKMNRENIYLSWHLASDIHALLNLISNFEISWKIHCQKALSYIFKEEFKERKKIYFEGKRFTFRRYLKLFVGKSTPLIWVSMVLELV